MRTRLSKMLKSLGTVVAIMALYLAGSVVSVSFFGSVTGTIIIDAVTVVAGLLYLYNGNRRNVFKTGMNIDFFTVILVIVLFFAVWLFGQIAGAWIYEFVGDPAYTYSSDTLSVSALSVVVLTLVAAPFAEEIMMRGIVFPTLKRGFHPVVALIIQALIFALIHGTYVQFIGTFIFALFLGLVYEYTGRLRYAIGFHIAFNTITLIGGSIAIPELFYSPFVWGSVNIVIVAVIIASFIYTIKRNTRVSGFLGLTPTCNTCNDGLEGYAVSYRPVVAQPDETEMTDSKPI